jgi:hypothetical protein
VRLDCLSPLGGRAPVFTPMIRLILNIVVNRLSENPDVKVGLIEAGVLHSEDPILYTPRSSKHANNPNYDWKFASEPQANAHGRVMSFSRYVASPLSLLIVLNFCCHYR